jgi:hypothetical protein
MRKLIAYRLLADAHPALIERLRVLYNTAIPFLATHRIETQTCESQQAWWRNLDHTKVMVHLYSPVEFPWEIVAFSQVTDRGTYCTPMFALSNLWWGKGYGEEIIEHYLFVASGKPLHGEQLTSNGAICHLNKRLGWKIISERDGMQTLVHPNNRQQDIYDEIIRYDEEDA